MKREKQYRGISKRLAIQYLENLGAEQVGENAVAADDWEATLSAEKVAIGSSLSLTEVTVVFEGSEDVLDPLVARFTQKARRAGG